MHFSRKGFTLIELLVVIAIIGLLASVVMASLNSAREKARDARRLADLKQITLALQLFYDEHGRYPTEPEANAGGSGTICSNCSGGINTILRQYMGGVPEDPSHNGSNYRYYYDGWQSCDGQTKAVVAAITLETSDGNRAEVCNGVWGGEGGIGSANSYNIVLGDVG